jgi:hypothetical protein
LNNDSSNQKLSQESKPARQPSLQNMNSPIKRWATFTDTSRQSPLPNSRTLTISPTISMQSSRNTSQNTPMNARITLGKGLETPTGFKSPNKDKENDSRASLRTPTISMVDTESYYEKKEMLEAELWELSEEKKRLTFELSRIPSSGHKAITRQEEIDQLLDLCDQNMARVRKQMRDQGFL